MSIYLGSSEPSKVYVGSNEVSAVYVGTTKVRPETIPLNGLLAYRPFENNANDISGNGYNGTVTGCSFGEISGKKGVRLASSFSEPSSNYIKTNLNYHQFPKTVIVWTYLLGLGNDWVVAATDNTSDSGSAIVIRFNSSKQLKGWAYGIAFGGGNYTGTWKMITITMVAGSRKLYIDGTLTGTYTGTDYTEAAGNYRFGTGCSWQGGLNQRCFPGWIRHCAVYNRELTADEVLDYYNKTK